jgi:hypothetical protein
VRMSSSESPCEVGLVERNLKIFVSDVYEFWVLVLWLGVFGMEGLMSLRCAWW